LQIIPILATIQGRSLHRVLCSIQYHQVDHLCQKNIDTQMLTTFKTWNGGRRESRSQKLSLTDTIVVIHLILSCQMMHMRSWKSLGRIPYRQ